MPVNLGTIGQPDFTQPIELMMDCHRRIEHFLSVLQRVVDRYDGELDGQGREALEVALNYFAEAAPRHTADEEESLFPRMREQGDPAVRQAFAQIDALEADHRVAEKAHARVEVIGRDWLRDGTLAGENRAEMKQLLADMASTYARHIRVEDEQVFALASHVLDPNALAHIGREMRQRRLSGTQAARAT